ncbi:MAG: HYR domain-containing protein [Acidobacteria bacterium]|nr:HYR domain-containing protein [Acidobacteriota bacterium]
MTRLSILSALLLLAVVPHAIADCALTCPANVTQSNDPNQCGAVITYPAPTDNGQCGTVTTDFPSGSFFPVGTTTVHVTSTSGSSCQFNVTVNDTQPPAITCPANITTSNDPNQCGAVVNYEVPQASDNCPNTTVQTSFPSGSFFPVGTTTVTVTAQDASGNTANCNFTVTVNDTQPPAITCPANQTVNATGPSGAVVNYDAPEVTDNCPTPQPTTCSTPSGSTFPVGTTTVQCTAHDAAGNSASCSFQVTVNPPFVPATSPWLLVLMPLTMAVLGWVALRFR